MVSVCTVDRLPRGADTVDRLPCDGCSVTIAHVTVAIKIMISLFV